MEVACEDIVDLSVTIVSSDMQPAVEEDQFPRWGNFTKLDIAQGQQCGKQISQDGLRRRRVFKEGLYVV